MWTMEDWARLARRLELRRYEMGYAKFKDFVAERGINYRTAWDAEHADGKGRTNFTRATLAALLDPAYGYVRGEGCENILNDEEPALAPDTPGGPEPELQSADLSSFTPEQQRTIRGIVKLLAAQEQADRSRSA